MATTRAYDRTCSRADVDASLRGLSPGRYGSSELYERYRAVCQGRGQTGARPVLYSSTLASLGVRWSIVRGRRRWFITEEMTRPEQPVTLTASIPGDVYRALESRAEQEGRTVNAMVAVLIAAAV